MLVIAIVEIFNPLENSQGMTNNVRLTFSVGDTTLWFTNSTEQDNWNW